MTRLERQASSLRQANRRRNAGLILTLGLIVGVGTAIRLLPNATTDSPAAKSEPHEIDRQREIDLRFKEAIIMLHAKRYEDAVSALHRVLKLAPTMPEAHTNMGYALMGLHRYTVARDFFNSAISLRPTQANAHYGLALTLGELGQADAAKIAMKEFLQLTPKDDPYAQKARQAIARWSQKQDKPR